MLLVTFHGGKQGVDDVGAYSDDGQVQSLKVLHGADSARSELRALAFVSPGLLWVLSGASKTSAILAFRGSGTRYDYVGTVAAFADIESLWHPFDFSLSFPYVYVSCQDTNVVARLKVAPDFLSAVAAPIAPSLPAGDFLAGTFVASADGDLPGVAPTTPVAVPAGLQVAFDQDTGKVVKSVRGVVWANGALYVADEVANEVKVYDATGRYLGGATVDGPVHLAVIDVAGQPTLYVCNGAQVFAGVLTPNAPARFRLDAVSAIKVPKVSGLALSSQGILFAGSRTSGSTATATATATAAAKDQPSVYRYSGFPKQLVPAGTFTVADAPEFLLHV